MSDETQNPGLSRGPIDALRTTLRNGIRRYRSLADAREARSLLLAFTVSFVAWRFITIALVVLSYQLGESVIAVGVMLAIQMVPGILFQPLAGSLVDKYPGRRLLVWCQLAYAFFLLSYLLLIPIPSIWLLYALSFLIRIVTTVDIPGYEVRLMLLTPVEKRGTANAVQSLAITFGEVVGPLVGGLLLALLGPSPIFILAAAVYVWYAYAINRLPDRVEGATRLVEEGDDAEAGNEAASVQGYRGILRRPSLAVFFLAVAAGYMIYSGLIPLFIVRAQELGMTEESIGIFYAVMGAGGFLGGIFGGMGTYTSKRALGISGLALAAGGVIVILFGIAGLPIIVFAALLVSGMLGEVEEISSLTYYQNTLPESIYGRFFSLHIVLASVGGFIGSLLTPFLADRYGTTFALTALGIPGVVAGLTLALRYSGLTLSRTAPSPVLAATPGTVASPGLLQTESAEATEEGLEAPGELTDPNDPQV